MAGTFWLLTTPLNTTNNIIGDTDTPNLAIKMLVTYYLLVKEK
jgi:hypothetical protein